MGLCLTSNNWIQMRVGTLYVLHPSQYCVTYSSSLCLDPAFYQNNTLFCINFHLSCTCPTWQPLYIPRSVNHISKCRIICKFLNYACDEVINLQYLKECSDAWRYSDRKYDYSPILTEWSGKKLHWSSGFHSLVTSQSTAQLSNCLWTAVTVILKAIVALSSHSQ